MDEGQEGGRQLSSEQVAAPSMVAQAREQGLALTGPNGLLKLFTKTVLETALNEEMGVRDCLADGVWVDLQQFGEHLLGAVLALIDQGEHNAVGVGEQRAQASSW